MDSLLNVNITLDFPLCEGIKPPKHIYLVMNPIIHVLCRVHLINHLASYFIFSILYVSSENVLPVIIGALQVILKYIRSLLYYILLKARVIV